MVSSGSAAPVHPIRPELVFERNVGQGAPAARFVARGRVPVAFTADGMVFAVAGGSGAPRRARAIRMRFAGTVNASTPVGEQPVASHSRYFIGRAPEYTAPHFSQVRYAGVYDGIDAVFHGVGGDIEYDLVVAAGANPRQIRIAFDGADSVRLESNTVVVRANGREARLTAPSVYQQNGDRRIRVASRYARRADGTVGIEIKAYDPDRELVIDPTLTFSTPLGGAADDDSGAAIAVDARGDMYIAGSTRSTDFPVTPGAWQPTAKPEDMFVAKISSAGTLLYSTFVGGGSVDRANSIVLESSGAVWVAGSTLSNDFPVRNAVQATRKGDWEGALLRLDAEGQLTYGSFIGGSGADYIYGIGRDGAGNIHLCGTTSSADFPRAGSLAGRTLGGFQDGFLVRLNAAATAITTAGLIGGNRIDELKACAVDAGGNTYLTGRTESADFPVANAMQAALNGSSDAFVVKVAASGQIAYSTYLGGSNVDSGTAIAADNAGNAYVGGNASADFPTVSAAIFSVLGGFLAKIDPTGQRLLYSTTLSTAATGIAVDENGSAYVHGSGRSDENNPLVHAFGRTCGALITRLSPDGRNLVYSTCLAGASGSASGPSLAIDREGTAYITGTATTGLPLINAVQSRVNFRDAYVARVIAANATPVVESASVDAIAPSGARYLRVTGSGFISSAVVRWNGQDRATQFGSDTRVGAWIPADDFLQPGTAQVSVFVPAPGGGLSNSVPFVIPGPEPAPVPVITRITYASFGWPRVEGTGFTQNSQVLWNGRKLSTQYIGSGLLEFIVPFVDALSPFAATITVYNPPPGGGTSNSRSFMLTSGAIRAIVASVSPRTIAAGSADTTITVYGDGFSANPVVRWNGSDRSTTVVNSRQLRAVISAADLAQVQTANISVFLRSVNSESNSVTVPVTTQAVAGLDRLEPGGAPAGSAALTLVITGTGFAEGAVVRWNGQDRPTTVVSPTRVEAAIAAADLSRPGLFQVAVFRPAENTVSNPIFFSVYLALPTNDIVYDKVSGLIFASIPTRAAAMANSIVSVDPATGSIGTPRVAGGNPGRVAVSGDGSALYVGLNDAGAARRLNLRTMEFGDPFLLATLGREPAMAQDVAVVPGNPDAVAIARQRYMGFPAHVGLTIYDHGVPRPREVSDRAYQNDSITFGSEGSTLYGLNNESSAYTFQTMRVDATGVAVTNTVEALVTGARGIRFDDGLVYYSNGWVVEPISRSRVGQYRLGPLEFFGEELLTPDAALGATFILVGGQGGYRVAAFRKHSFDLIAEVDIAGVEGFPSRLFRWGADGLAFRTDSDQLFMFRVPFEVTGDTSPVRPGALANSASYDSRLAAGQIVALFGTGLATTTAAASSSPLPAELAGTRVTIDGVAAPLFFVSPGQINLQLPFELAGRAQASVVVSVNGITGAPLRISLAPAAPGMFSMDQTGRGVGAVLIASTGEIAAPAGAVPGRASRPVRRGEYISIYCTGLGAVTNPPVAGAPATSSPLSIATTVPNVAFGGVNATASFAGLAPGFVGLYQVNVQVPMNAAPGPQQAVYLNTGGVAANIVTIAIE